MCRYLQPLIDRSRLRLAILLCYIIRPAPTLNQYPAWLESEERSSCPCRSGHAAIPAIAAWGRATDCNCARGIADRHNSGPDQGLCRKPRLGIKAAHASRRGNGALQHEAVLAA